MNLHNDKDNFADLISITAEFIGIPFAAVKRDYFIVKLLQNLQNSEFAERCVFKGGTSLSKCYPGSIERFSEDIDLTFIPNDILSNKQYSNILKKIESTIIGDAFSEKIISERNDRNKSSTVWFDYEDKEGSKVKLEFGSNIKPDPYGKRKLKTYIQEYLESKDLFDVIREFKLAEVEINVLSIERTFIDKVFAVKRHALCGSIAQKVRHIYDVTKIFDLPEIQSFLLDKKSLMEIVRKTKNTDSFYLEKRAIAKEYNPTKAYDFDSWENRLDSSVKAQYESLHKFLLYDKEKQDFSKAIKTFKKINELFVEIKE